MKMTMVNSGLKGLTDIYDILIPRSVLLRLLQGENMFNSYNSLNQTWHLKWAEPPLGGNSNSLEMRSHVKEGDDVMSCVRRETTQRFHLYHLAAEWVDRRGEDSQSAIRNYSLLWHWFTHTSQPWPGVETQHWFSVWTRFDSVHNSALILNAEFRDKLIIFSFKTYEIVRFQRAMSCDICNVQKVWSILPRPMLLSFFRNKKQHITG